jgi:hypothetical protein
MPVSGIRQIREIFSDNLPKGYSLMSAYMSYDHQTDVERQILTFQVIDPGGITHIIKSDMIPAKYDVMELALKTAQKFRENIKTNGTSTGNNEQDSRERLDRETQQKDPYRNRGDLPRPDGIDETGPDGISGNGPEAA